ncbi:hypothetical protein [Clostridium estertheticum]|uniref:hypothetical protein n=1 Tax=Clostridium estertheticum TaxID=238834 RepID=UPI001C0A98C7|nr:hypothetical protein [Clostridium estertheticum]MBU3186503.1 hypothetical protein [Clostridium estertheticum]
MVNAGKVFENSFKESIPSNCYYLRLKDPASSFGAQDNKTLRFSITNPFDCLLFNSPNLFTLELKSTKGTAFSFKGKTPMIKAKQIEGLSHAAKFEDIIPGFIFNMREPTNRTYFLHINNFNKFIASTEKSSINEKDIIDAGAMVIDCRLKKVKYAYRIREFIDEIKEYHTENFKDMQPGGITI